MVLKQALSRTRTKDEAVYPERHMQGDPISIKYMKVLSSLKCNQSITLFV